MRLTTPAEVWSWRSRSRTRHAALDFIVATKVYLIQYLIHLWDGILSYLFLFLSIIEQVSHLLSKVVFDNLKWDWISCSAHFADNSVERKTTYKKEKTRKFRLTLILSGVKEVGEGNVVQRRLGHAQLQARRVHGHGRGGRVEEDGPQARPPPPEPDADGQQV